MLALAVIFTGAKLRAEGNEWSGPGPSRCFDRLVTSAAPEASHRTPLLGGPLALASVQKVERPSQAPVPPGQSRAPIICLDPHQQGCQVEAPDAPRHHGGGLGMDEAISMADLFAGIPPVTAVEYLSPALPHNGPRAAHSLLPWRPPAA